MNIASEHIFIDRNGVASVLTNSDKIIACCRVLAEQVKQGASEHPCKMRVSGKTIRLVIYSGTGRLMIRRNTMRAAPRTQYDVVTKMKAINKHVPS